MYKFNFFQQSVQRFLIVNGMITGKILRIWIVLFSYVSAFFHDIDIVDIHDFESDMFFEILEPQELAYTYRIRPAVNFGIPINDSMKAFKAKLVPTEPPYCCNEVQNSYKLRGNVALVERGQCTFKQKALRAEAVGAKALIISDYDHLSDVYIDMLDDESRKETKISAAFLLGQNGHIIKKVLRKLNRDHAEINYPLNLTRIGVHNKRQPPWLVCSNDLYQPSFSLLRWDEFREDFEVTEEFPNYKYLMSGAHVWGMILILIFHSESSQGKTCFYLPGQTVSEEPVRWQRQPLSSYFLR